MAISQLWMDMVTETLDIKQNPLPQPTQFFPPQLIHLDITDNMGDTDDVPHRIHLAQMDIRRDQANTGASVSATGIREILHDFQTHTQYEIAGYDGLVTAAAGQGIAKVWNRLTGKTEDIFFVYTPSISGIIISLEHHAKTHPDIHRWVQEGTPSHDQGSITFYSIHDDIISRYETLRRNGSYYVQQLEF